MEITSVQQLREIIGHPADMVVNKVRARLQPVHTEWLARSPMVFLATADAGGRLDVSPKGDPPGKVVHVVDDTTIAVPERPGNRRVDGYLNILANPNVGTVFIMPGRGDTLRINGRARLVSDAPYFDALAVNERRPVLAVEIHVEEVFFHCAKAFLRSELWSPDTWDPAALPSAAQIAKRVMDELDDGMLEERYAEDTFRKYLY